MIPVQAFEGRDVAVFGLGRSGLTAARALAAGSTKRYRPGSSPPEKASFHERPSAS